MKIVKRAANIIDSHVTNIIDNDLSKNLFYNSTKVASVRPIIKKADRTIINNYRRVSLLNCFQKLMKSF